MIYYIPDEPNATTTLLALFLYSHYITCQITLKAQIRKTLPRYVPQEGFLMKVYDLSLWGIELLLLFDTHVSHKHFNLCFHFFIVLHYFFIVFFHACIVCFYLFVICFHLCIFSLKCRYFVL